MAVSVVAVVLDPSITARRPSRMHDRHGWFHGFESCVGLVPLVNHGQLGLG